MVTEPAVRGVRARTRQAILDAAIDVLSQNPAATLAEIAEAAEVGRTTLHRYFPERSDLLKAVYAEGVARLDRAMAEARTEEGTGAAALLRLVGEYFELGAMLSLIFNDPQLIGDAVWTEEGACDPRFISLVKRGYEDGTIDPELPVEWLQSVIWTQLYAAWHYMSDRGTSRHAMLKLLIRTVEGAVRRPGSAQAT